MSLYGEHYLLCPYSLLALHMSLCVQWNILGIGSAATRNQLYHMVISSCQTVAFYLVHLDTFCFITFSILFLSLY